MLDELEIPEWVSALLTEKFFNSCLIHEEEQKNDKTFLCLNCCEGICHLCLVDHTSHHLLKIRRYVYLDVIRLCDGEKVMDCSKIQPYTTNGAKVLFLKQKPFSRPPSVNSKQCLTCDRNLHEPYCYCSICCKVEHLLETGCNLFKCFCKSDCLSQPGLEDGQMTPVTVLEIAGSARTESGSVNGIAENGLMECTATTVVKKKKRTSITKARSTTKPVCVSVYDVLETKPICEPVCEILETKPVCEISETKSVCKPVGEISEQGVFQNRRKGMPRRSPFL